jgi:hypothetical protein
MAQVLAAEAAARESVAQARNEARHTGERSRAAVRALAERTQRRVRHLRAAFGRTGDAEVAALQAQAEALSLPAAPGSGDAARIARAVARLAAQLTGGAP